MFQKQMFGGAELISSRCPSSRSASY